MKKNLLKLFGLIVTTIAILLISINPTYASTKSVGNKELNKNAYESNIAKNVEETIKIKDEVYPDYYGGMYISDDSENLIIQIVKKNIPSETSVYSLKKFKDTVVYNQMLNMDDSIVVEYVDNSYNELNQINNKIIEYFSSDNVEYKNLRGNFVDILSNKVIVELNENTKEQQELFKNVVVDSDLITFVQLDEEKNFVGTPKEENPSAYAGITIKSGQAIFMPKGTCSLGFRAKIGGKYGFLTAAHCANSINEKTTYGTITKFMEAKKVDAAFIETTSLYTISNSLMYTGDDFTTLNTDSYPALTVNTEIGKVGATTKYTRRVVKSTNYSGSYDGIYFTDLIATTAGVDGGDSGGIVFTAKNVNGGVTAAGIVKGTSSYGMAFTSAQHIYNSFMGYTRY